MLQRADGITSRLLHSLLRQQWEEFSARPWAFWQSLPCWGGFALRKGWCHGELGSPAWCRNEFPMLNAGALLWGQGCGSALCWLWGKDAGDVPGAALVRSGRERGRACRGQELVLEGVRV